MKNVCMFIELLCPGCGQFCRSIGQLGTTGWECPVCGYYDKKYDWLSTSSFRAFETDMNFEEIDFEMEAQEKSLCLTTKLLG